MKRYLTILLPVLLLLATFAGAETIPLKELLREAQSATRKNYPDSDTVLLYNHEKIRYEKTGLSESTDEFYQKVLTEKGRKDLRSMTLHYNSTYGDLQVEKLQIIRNGKLQ